ncbi:hypothetical protein [Pedobacter sandarakinus]|uniref:hypothetical protein n=1 Tax=Pedobacter sandarakinus TaxID=353156 RepID=UPI00224530D2|nr:hypothetical protein [Pedobacter sandarakinus]MCX2573185.1 hypothetical protein [Pedobacter sandarakinus]
MNNLKSITYNCKQATFLIEKKQLTTLSLKERVELSFHLTGCAVCRLYQRQSIFITRLTKDIFSSTAQKNDVLTDDFKAKLQETIEHELDKK